MSTCSDPGIFSRGVQARRPENSLDNVFFSPQLILQFYIEGVQRFYYRENNTFPRIQRGPTFSRGGGGSNFFPGGAGELQGQMLISIETHVFCDFPGGSGPPIPPLDLHMVHYCLLCMYFAVSYISIFVLTADSAK